MLNILTLIFFSILVFGQEFTESQRQFIKEENLLKNPGGENGRTDWVLTAGVLVSESSIVVSGKRSLKATLTAQALTFHQDSALYQAQFADGVQGLAMVRVKTSISGLRVCSRQNGVINSSLCVSVQANGKWGLYKVPFTLGGTSNGISINSNGTSVTGDVYIDDAFVGAVDLKVDSPTINFQSSYISQAASYGIATITGALTESKGSGNFSYNSGTGIYTVLKRSQFTVSASFRGSASAAVQPIISGSAYADSSVGQSVSTLNSWTSTSFGFIGEVGSTFLVKNGANTTDTQRISVSSQEIGSSSVYSSNNADTDWASCGHTTSSFTGFGTVTAIETQCKRQGGDLLMKGKFTSGTSTAVEARLALPTWNGVALTSKGSPVIPSIQQAGPGAILSVVDSYGKVPLIEPSVAYLTFGAQTTGVIGLNKLNGSAVMASGNSLSFNARIPINGWENSNIIIGQFNGLESCTDTYECTDTYSAKVSATGIVSDENNDWITGNFSVASTNQFTGTFRASLFTVAPNCVVTFAQSPSTAVYGAYIASTSAASIRVDTNDNTNIAARAFNISCQKQGVDYIGKTAKAVASDQNVKTPGAIGVDNFSFSFGTTNKTTVCSASPCSYLDQIGNVVTSLIRGGVGTYSASLSKTYSKIKCTKQFAFLIAGQIHELSYPIDVSNSSTINFNVSISSTGGAVDTYGTINCIGIP